MNEVLTIDTTRLNARIFELRDAFEGQGADVSTIFEDESRLFLKQVIRLTPPKTRQQGEAAVARDLMKIFTPVNEEMLNLIGSEHGVSNIDAWIASADGTPKHLNWRKIDPTGDGMAAFHNRNRDSRGRTYSLKRQKEQGTWYAPYVVSFEDMARYRDKIKSHVGRRKAAWAKSFTALGGKVSSWFDPDKKGLRGEFHNSTNPQHPSITMINRAPGIGQDLHFIRGAVRVRQQAIMRRIRLVVSGYSKDVAQGIRIQRKAHKTPESLLEAA
jgi:hypothetical protein